MIFEFQGAQGVGHPLQRILQGMGEIVHGIDAPFVPLSVVMGVIDPVKHRVPHIEVAAGQIDFRPQGHSPVGEFPGFHPGEEI